MTHSCAEGQFMDRLVLKCVSCSVHCQSEIPKRCYQYCLAWRCRKVSGQFYDALLNKCLQCSELCGRHPVACEHTCSNSLVPLVTDRGRAVSGSALLSEALLYGLLGLCVTVLMFSLSAAVLLLLRRNKHRQHITDKEKQQTSKDSLMARADEVSQEGSVNQDRLKATETCVYCFTEHTERPQALLQQAGDREPVRGPILQGLPQPLHAHADKGGALRIICSPTQTSM